MGSVRTTTVCNDDIDKGRGGAHGWTRSGYFVEDSRMCGVSSVSSWACGGFVGQAHALVPDPVNYGSFVGLSTLLPGGLDPYTSVVPQACSRRCADVAVVLSGTPDVGAPYPICPGETYCCNCPSLFTVGVGPCHCDGYST